MTPLAYRSPWCDKTHYLIRLASSFAVVADGVQPTEARLIFDTKRDATAWLRDNGFLPA